MVHLLTPHTNWPLHRWPKLLPVLFCLLLVGLLADCSSGSSAKLERQQADNLRLTKALHTHLNQHDWPAVSGLCAETVRYRGRATQFTDVEESKARFLAHYRHTLRSNRPGFLEVQQMYTAGNYHVIAEGVLNGQPPDTPLPICLIYTIENKHITRLYAY